MYLAPEQRAPAYREHTLAKLQSVSLYQDQVRFAELTTADLTPANAAELNALAKQMLHFSPEARVVEIVIDSARLLGRKDEVMFYAARYKAAFPRSYAVWARSVSDTVARP